MQDNRSIWIILLLLALVAGAAWWFLGRHEPAEQPLPSPAATPMEAEPEATPATPHYPVGPPVDGDEPRPDLRPLPPLDESDEYFRLELIDLFGEAVAEIIVSEALIEKLVATVDNLPRPRVAERIRPVAPPEGQFAVRAQDSSGEYLLSTDNYRRYDSLVARFVEADLDKAAEVYRRFYPLFQKAYEGLGYPDGYFNDRLVEVIDHLLATPDVSQPVALVRPHVLYEFADPELEALSGGQKLLIRIGPEHREAVSDKLSEFRTLIAAGG